MKNNQAPYLLTILQNTAFNEGEHWQTKTYSAGQTVLTEGDDTSSLYLILNGRARVVANITLNSEKTIHPGFKDLTQYDIFGELSFINNQRHSTNITAVTDCEIAVIENKHLEQFLNSHPEHGLAFYKEIARTLALRLNATNTKAYFLLAWGLNYQGIDLSLIHTCRCRPRG